MARIDDLEKGLVDQYGVSVKAELDKDGNEVGDPTPVAPPAHLRRTMTMSEQIQQMIRREFSMRASEEGFETFEEAEDFDIDDDPADPHTPYEAVFDPPPPVKEKPDGRQGDVDTGEPGGVVDDTGGSRKGGKVKQGKSKPGEEPDDKGGVREASFDNSGSEE